MTHAEQIIVIDYPPIYDEIVAVFRLYDRTDVIFAWGNRVYNPHGLVIPTHLLAHEAVHGGRQGERDDDIRDWWARYMCDRGFRLSEEVLAHRAEYVWLLQHAPRKQRRSALKQVAERLSSPLYGRMTTPPEARRIIAAALDS